MNTDSDASRIYEYVDARQNPSHNYLLPVLDRVIGEGKFPLKRAIDVGCGNGSITRHITQRGFKTIGIEPSEKGLAIARNAYPHIEFFPDSGYTDLSVKHGRFDLVVSLEVIEHLYNPKLFIKMVYKLLADEGVLVVSTPYHGYWKNLGLSLLGKWDKHHQALRLGGHVKFFSAAELVSLLESEGFEVLRIERVGRAVPSFAKSMVAVATRRMERK